MNAYSGRTPALDDDDHHRLQELVAEQPHQLRSLHARFQEETGKNISMVTLRSKRSFQDVVDLLHVTEGP